MKTISNIFKGCLLSFLFLILIPVTIIVYIVGLLEMLGGNLDCPSDTNTIINFEAFRIEMQNRIKKIYE